MDFPIWAWVLVDIVSALFVALTWLPVGALTQKCCISVLDPLKPLNGGASSVGGDEYFMGYVFLIGYLVVCVIYAVVKISSLIPWALGALFVFSWKVAERIIKTNN